MAGRIKFYTDEHIPKAVIKGLRERGVDVLSVPEAGTLGASDEEHLERAGREKRVVIPADDDFLRLATAGVEHDGIIHLSRELSIGKMIQAVMLIHQVLDPDEMINHVEYF